MIGKLATKEFGEEVWIDLSGWAKNVTIFVSHVNAHQRVTSAEEDVSNQVDRMTRSLDSNWPLSPDTKCPLSYSKVSVVPGMEMMCGLSNVDFHSPSPARLWPLLSAQSASNRD